VSLAAFRLMLLRLLARAPPAAAAAAAAAAAGCPVVLGCLLPLLLSLE
jgi:hypothetical protein